MTKRALVSGGAGFIGSHVADRLLAEGYQVEILDNLSSGRRENLPKGAIFHQIDIGSEDAARVVRDGRFDVLCHLAAQIDVRKSVLDPMYDARINILGIAQPARGSARRAAMRRVSCSRRRVARSTATSCRSRASRTCRRIRSRRTASRSSASSCTSATTRASTSSTRSRCATPTCTVRARIPHGEAGVVAIFCNRVLKGEPLTVFGDGMQTRDYVFAGDVARANVAAATVPLPIRTRRWT